MLPPDDWSRKLDNATRTITRITITTIAFIGSCIFINSIARGNVQLTFPIATKNDVRLASSLGPNSTLARDLIQLPLLSIHVIFYYRKPYLTCYLLKAGHLFSGNSPGFIDSVAYPVAVSVGQSDKQNNY